MDQKILEIINTVLLNRGKKTIETINQQMNLRDDIGFDSLDLAELTVRIEAEYGIDIFEDGIIFTVGEMLKKITK